MHFDEISRITRSTPPMQDLVGGVDELLDVNGDLGIRVCQVSDWLNTPDYTFERWPVKIPGIDGEDIRSLDDRVTGCSPVCWTLGCAMKDIDRNYTPKSDGRTGDQDGKDGHDGEEADKPHSDEKP